MEPHRLTVIIQGVSTIGLAVATAREAQRLVTRIHLAGRPWVMPVSAVLISMLLMLTMFWYFADYAASVGTAQAQARAMSLSERAQIVLYSQDDLRIEGPGVEVVQFDGDSKYRFRYTGLTLLLRADDRYFLLPGHWSPGVRSVVVPVNDALRVDFLPEEASRG